MRPNIKRLLTVLALVGATQTTSVVQADSIRVIGPTGEVQTSPSYDEQVERALPVVPQSAQPSQFYGPTGANETLWSIASQLRPNNSVSVQQTLLAIYRINPRAFEQQNIHQLVPGSRLRVPSLSQIRSATTSQASSIMNAHQARLGQAAVAPQQATPVAPAPKVVEVQKLSPQVETPAPSAKAPVTEPKSNNTAKPDVPKVNEGQVDALKEKLQVSQTELESLEEKNHRLRLMLADVQTEVDVLKEELGDEERIRSEVEKLLAEERARLEKEARMKPGMLDQFLSNPWLLLLAALIPGALLAMVIIMFLSRRNSEEEAPAEQETKDIEDLDKPIDLDDSPADLTLGDDVFGDKEEDDPFGNLDSEELDFNLDGEEEDPFASIGDDGDLDLGLDELESSSNGISVGSDEKALGLKEMEQALDEAGSELELTDDAFDGDFDLSDDDDSGPELGMSDDEFANLLSDDEPSEELGSDSLDQSMLDDLLSDMGDDMDFSLDDDSFDELNAEEPKASNDVVTSDDDIDALLSQNSPDTDSLDDDLLAGFDSGVASDDEIDALLAQNNPIDDAQDGGLEESFNALEDSFDAGVASDDEIDALLAQNDPFALDEPETNPEVTSTDDIDALLAQNSMQPEPSVDSVNDAFDSEVASDDEIDQLLAQNNFASEQDNDDLLDDLESLSGLSDDSLELDSDESALLDELLEGDDSEELTGLDALDELEELAGLTDEPQLEEDSTDLLDELVGFDDDESDDDNFDPLEELDQLSALSDDASELELDEDSTDLLDDFLDLSDDASDSVQDSTQEPDDELFADLLTDSFEEDKSEESEEPFSTELDLPDFDNLLDESEPEQPNVDSEEPAFNEVSEQVEAPQPNFEAQAFNSDNFFDDLDSISPKDDALLAEDAEKQQADFASELDSLLEIDNAVDELSPVTSESEEAVAAEQPASEESVFEELELEEPVLEEPEVTPTPNTKPNEFGIPQEEDWAFDEPEAELPEFNLEDELDLPDFTSEPTTQDSLDAQPVEDGLESPDFGEAEAAKLAVDDLVEPEIDTQPLQQDTDVELNDFELPEFGEDDALSALQEETVDEALSEQAEPVGESPDFELDDFELPEFNEEDAIASTANETTPPQSEPAEQPDTEFNFDDFELPEFGEDAAAASMAEELAPESEPKPEPAAEAATEDESFDLSDFDLPEFGEEDAMASVAEESVEPAVEQVADENDDFELADFDLPEFNEDDAAASVLEELNEAQGQAPQPSLANDQNFEFDDLELPEFGEEDAAASMLDELDEPVADKPTSSEESFDFDELDLSEFNEEDAAASMLDELNEPEIADNEEAAFGLDDLDLPESNAQDALSAALDEQSPASEAVTDESSFDFDDLDLPEFGEEDAAASVQDELDEPVSHSEPVAEDESFNFDDLELPEFDEDDALESFASYEPAASQETNTPQEQAETPVTQAPTNEEEQDALFGLFSDPEPTSFPESTAQEAMDLDEAAMADLLSEDLLDAPVDNSVSPNLTEDSVASAGMDFEAMLEVGEDWNGFQLAPEQAAQISEDVPADEQEVWSSMESLTQPELEQENWGAQDDLADFDPKKNQFMTIDELMAQVDKEGGDFEEQELKLDVGLNEFPDVIGDTGSDVDVDDDADAVGKLDLAKIYLEMNDPQGAIKLLEEAIVFGDDTVRREAKGLIDVINSRG